LERGEVNARCALPISPNACAANATGKDVYKAFRYNESDAAGSVVQQVRAA